MSDTTTARKHLARRWYGTGFPGSLTLRCTCGQWETSVGTTREKEDAHRAHRVDMGEIVKPRKPSKLEQLEAENRELREQLAQCRDRALTEGAELIVSTARRRHGGIDLVHRCASDDTRLHEWLAAAKVLFTAARAAAAQED
jgi:hypothetical protein